MGPTCRGNTRGDRQRLRAGSRMKRVLLDRVTCEGHGMCEVAAPAHFELDDEGKLTVLEPQVSADDELRVQEAVRSCPVAALRLEA
ncbi:ferredoxin [Streptomyces sp. NPDC048278]|uniref:ferredoxin n=1 Tax=Streptomyces sp. NPDC048278 TaxID=3155809 RepID=UPI003438E8CA